MNNTIIKDVMEKILKKNGLKVTPSRSAILNLLIKSDQPTSVEDIHKKLNNEVDITTIYRFLNKLVDKNVIYKTNLGNNKSYFELQKGHHHHIICKDCGTRERVNICINEKNKEIIKESKNFSILESHILEFFGRCNKCS